MTAMRRFLALLFVATTAFAQSRGRAAAPVHLSANTVSGIVTSVNGSLISLAGGLVVIDASGAKMTSDVAAGALIVAFLNSGDVALNAPLAATSIVVTPLVPVTLSGTVSAVDRAGATLTVLGRTVKTNAQTKFTGLMTLLPMSLNDIFPNQLVVVEANVSGGALVAASVRVVSPPPTPQIHFTGYVKSIGPTQWVIGGPPGSMTPDFLVLVNASTKISDDPKVGDRVEIVGDVTANGIVASSISKAP
jgi:hypothetical protein